MRRMLLVAPLIVAACATQSAPPLSIHSVPPGAKCVESVVLNSFIGQPASTELGARLMSASTARVLRWVPEGTAITMEHREDRLTVWLDENNRVERLNCG